MAAGMKKIMDRMMPFMMKGLSPDDKKDMMLEMMPEMMKDVDMADLMPRMMVSMMPQIMASMRPEGGVARFMGTTMPTMFSLIDMHAVADKKDEMLEQLMTQEQFRGFMPQCFAEEFPHMVRGNFVHFLPELSREQRITFVRTMFSLLLESGCADMSTDELEDLSSLVAARGAAAIGGSTTRRDN